MFMTKTALTTLLLAGFLSAAVPAQAQDAKSKSTKSAPSVQTVPTSLPAEFKLSQNYPNPFNPSTSIAFTVPQKSDVAIRIYDLLGREVALVASGVREAGNYTVAFNAGNLPSGIYFYKLIAGEFVETKRMILAK